MKTKFIDNIGEIETEILFDGDDLKIKLNGLEFTSRFIDDFVLSNKQQTENSRFQFNVHGELTNYRLIIQLPIRLSIDSKISEQILECELKINKTKDNYNQTIGKCFLKIQDKIIDSGEFDLFETGLDKLINQLPNNIKLICCYSCLYSDYSVYGQGFWGTMICFKNIKSDYLKVKDKDEYMEIMDNHDDIVAETHYCNDFKLRIKNTGYRG
jgi:hypothetical protein